MKRKGLPLSREEPESVPTLAVTAAENALIPNALTAAENALIPKVCGIFSPYDGFGSSLAIATSLCLGNDKKVLLVDCDSRCITTACFPGESHLCNVHSMLQPLIERGNLPLVKSSATIFNWQLVEHDLACGPRGISVLKGSRHLFELEEVFSRIKEDEWYPMAKYGLRWLVNSISARMGFEYVIIDFGSSHGELCMNWLSTCDVIMPVFTPDARNITALDFCFKSFFPKMLDVRQQYIHFYQDRKLDKMKQGLLRRRDELLKEIDINDFHFLRCVTLMTSSHLALHDSSRLASSVNS